MTHGGKNGKSVAPKSILSLVERFELYQESYRSGQYNEAQLRHDFLDPFWEILGWDIHNKQGFAEAYRDVVYEDALRIGHATKAPDYCFRIGGTRKFFLEAKKPSVPIKEDVSPAFQLRRYAWSAKLPLSVLSNFEEFVVYDTHVRPVKDDPASTARIFSCTFREYAEKWDWIASIFSRDAVLKGSFDKFAEGTRAKRGTASVDDAFLDEIESWRKALAQNLALRNPKLTQRELNFAVQCIIDRIIFLRICEDRNIEDYGRLLALVNGGDIYQRLCDLFQEADDKYNSGLFHFKAEKGRHEPPDELTPGLHVDDKLLRDVLRNLYYPESPYEFSVLSIDILGQVYERFLGKTIRLTEGHRAVVEDKPEVKKAGGIYYTPTYIVNYIVKNTVGKLLEGKTPPQAAKLRILDPACGSGSFLIGAFQYLLDWHLDWYVANDPKKRTKGSKPALLQAGAGGWKLTIAERKRILLNNIFGVDIDSQAVEVTKLSLLLRVLEGETEQTLQPMLRFLHERALPDLGDNIKCGNSLISHDVQRGEQIGFLIEEEQQKINPFEWGRDGFCSILKDGGFDVVIGNPPYLFITELSKQEKDYFGTKYSTCEYRFDVYGLFIELSLRRLLKQGGLLSLIIPHTLLSNDSFEKLRRMLLQHSCLHQVIDIGPGVFQNAKNETMVFVAEKRGTKCKRLGRCHIVLTKAPTFPAPTREFTIEQSEWFKNPKAAWLVRNSPDEVRLLSKLDQADAKLGNLCTINQGLRTGDNEKYLSNQAKSSTWKPAVGGKEIDRYGPLPHGLFVYYKPSVLDAPRRREIFESTEKLVVQEIRNITLPRRIVATYDHHQFFCLQSTNVINLRPEMSVEWPLTYVLAVLNSSLINFFFRQRFSGNNHIASNQLAQIPVMAADQKEKIYLVRLADRMLALHRKRKSKTPAEQTALVRQITATDAQIDRLVYELYGLTEQEIKIVESAT
jgi:hypothetical protein